MIRRIIGFGFILFGLIGFLLEMGHYFQEEVFDVFGLVLACFIILIGFVVFFWPSLKAFWSQRRIPKTQREKIKIWERSFLLVTGIAELIIGIPLFIFILFLGIQGIIAGEMGIMIGFFSLNILIILFPYFSLRFLVVYGLAKRKSWANYLALVFGGLFFIFGFIVFFGFPFLSLLLFGYGGVTIWAGIKCSKSLDLKTG